MLGDSLLKIVSLISPSSPLDNYGLYFSSQCETARKTITEEKQKLLAALKQSSNDEDLTDDVLKIYKIIEYTYMNVFNQGQHTSEKIQKCENYNLLDGDSKTFWNTYSRLYYFIESKYRDELDYSAFILYLGKIVETELNLSVCQMLRQSMGIAMPLFYNKYCHTTNKVYIPTANQDILLNKYIYKPTDGRKILEGVALGNLLHAYKTAIGIEISYNPNWQVPNPENLENMPSEFLSLWEDFSKVRNDAAHSRSVDIELYKTTEKFFEEFQDSYISRLYPIKKRLRPGNRKNNRLNRH